MSSRTASEGGAGADDDGDGGEQPDAAVDGEVAEGGRVGVHWGLRWLRRCGLQILDVFEGADEAGAEFAEFARVVVGEVLENLAAFAGDGEDDAAAVVGVFGAEQKAFGYGAVDELDDGVVPEAEALGGVGDGGERAGGRSGDLEQELMLLGVKIDFVCGLLAEVGEGAEVVAELG